MEHGECRRHVDDHLLPAILFLVVGGTSSGESCWAGALFIANLGDDVYLAGCG